MSSGLREIETPHQGALINDVPDVIISNYHKLAGWAEALTGKVRSVIFDEAQELRGGGGRKVPAKYEAATAIAREAQYRLGLTATPIYNYGGEFHSVLSVLDADGLGTRREFTTEWCTNGDGEKARIKEPAAFGTWLRDQGLMLRRTRSDVGRELPAVSTIVQPVDIDLDLGASGPADPVALATKILADGGSGFEKMRSAAEFDMLLRLATGMAKAPQVATFVRMLVESGEQVTLFGWHRAVYEIWAKVLADLGVVFYTGHESPAQKAASVEAFTKGDAKVLVISLRAGAGLDGLQHVCKTVVFGELDWSPGVHIQCVGRIGRDGQKDPVFVYMLLADCGSDPVVADVLGLKRTQIDRAIDPDAPVIAAEVDPDHVKKLARAYLQQVGKLKANREEAAA